MKITMLGSVRFAIAKPNEEMLAAGAPIMLSFEVQQDLPGGLQVAIERVDIPFSAEAWERFGRAVVAGEVSQIAIARPNGRMDVPKI